VQGVGLEQTVTSPVSAGLVLAAGLAMATAEMATAEMASAEMASAGWGRIGS